MFDSMLSELSQCSSDSSYYFSDSSRVQESTSLCREVPASVYCKERGRNYAYAFQESVIHVVLEIMFLK